MGQMVKAIVIVAAIAASMVLLNYTVYRNESIDESRELQVQETLQKETLKVNPVTAPPSAAAATAAATTSSSSPRSTNAPSSAAPTAVPTPAATTTGAPTSAPTMTVFAQEVVAARQAASAVRREVVARYNFSSHADFDGSVLPILSHLMRFSNEATIVNRFMLRIAERSQITFAWAGTSVSAGHDNLYREAYAARFQALMERVFKPLGVRLESRNCALGANPLYPYTWCLETHCGDNLDVLGWEMEMMAGPPAQDRNKEAWARRSFAMPSKPSIAYLDSFIYSYMPPRDYPQSREYIGYVAEPQLFERYANTTAAPHELYLSAIWYRLFKNRDGTSQRLQYADPTWYLNDKCCGAASWHPGPHGHQMFADMLAMGYLRLLDQALQKLLRGEKPVPISEWPDFRPEMVLKLPADTVAFEREDPNWAPAIECDTMLTPNYDPAHRVLLDRVVNKKDVLDPRPVITDVAAFNPQQWLVTLAPQDIGAVRRAIANGAGYQDFKWTLYGKKGSPPLRLQFVSEKGPLAVCSPPLWWDQWYDGFGPVYNTTFATATLDNKPVTIKQGPQANCAIVGDADVSKGKHELVITPLSDTTIVQISHLVYLKAAE